MATIPQVGGQLGNYRIERLLELGGMSLVYLAEHVGLGRKVALKVLAPELAEDERFRERFIRESRLAVSIDHPNIVPIYDAGEIDGVLYMAMLYVEGITLKDLIQDVGPMDPEQALAILTPVAAALDAAHARGLVHRDVKPGNVLLDVRPVDGVSHVYLSDFGLTKRAESRSGLTLTGTFAGTVDYIAPEQIRGHHSDRRADIYSLGCVAYECLTGTGPFEADNQVAILWAHLQDPPPRVTSLRPELPPTVDNVMARAMSKEPEDRYGSAGEFIDALRNALSPQRTIGGPVKAQPTVLRSRPEGMSAPPAPVSAKPQGQDQPASAPVREAATQPPAVPASTAAPPAERPLPAERPQAHPPPPAEQQPGPPAPPEPRRDRRRAVAIPVALLLVAAVAGAGYLLGRSSTKEAPKVAGQSTPVPPAAGAGCTDIVGNPVSVGGSQLTEGTVTCLLAKHVPSPVRSGCQTLSGKTDAEKLPLVGQAKQPPASDVFLMCPRVTYLGNTFSVWYMFKHDRDEVGLDYRQVLTSNNISVDQNSSADHCASTNPIERRWWVLAGSVSAATTNIVHTFDESQAIPLSKFYPVSGRFLCFQDGADEWITWTDANLTVLGAARNTGGNWDKFQSWWSLDAGPGHPPGV
jgi:serine/threonine protein kinase